MVRKASTKVPQTVEATVVIPQTGTYSQALQGKPKMNPPQDDDGRITMRDRALPTGTNPGQRHRSKSKNLDTRGECESSKRSKDRIEELEAKLGMLTGLVDGVAQLDQRLTAEEDHIC